MSVMDTIADYLTRIRNAQGAMHETVSVPHSRIKEALTLILKDEGYVSGFKLEQRGAFKEIAITLKYLGDRDPAIRKLTRVSKPGRRVYVSKDEIPLVLGGLGINILSTSKGVLTGQRAQSEGVGGELLLEVY